MKIISFHIYVLIVVLRLNLIQGAVNNCEKNKVGVNVVDLKEKNSTAIETVPYENSTCTWQIIVPKGHIIEIVPSRMNYKFSINDCKKENFIIYDGNSTSDYQVAKYCADNKPGTLVYVYLSGSYGMLVLKQGDPASPRKKFYVYAEKKKDNCNDGKVLKLKAASTLSNFTSPNYPHPTHPGAIRQWLIEAPSGKYVKLEITDVSYYFCKTTTLNVYDGDSENPTELIRNLCNKKDDDYIFQYPKLTIFSKAQKLFVYFKSLAYIQYPINNKGFQAFYSAVEGVASCGVRRGNAVIHLQGDNGTIHSPNYPSYHPSNLTCRWDVSVSVGQFIEITMATSAFREDCSKQWVHIYDGSKTSSPLLLKLCSYKDSKPFFSSSNQIVVEFVTTGTVQSKGFSISYTARSTKPRPYACLNSKHRLIKNSTNGYIASPRFPLNYLNSARCWFDIEVPLGNFVYLTFKTFDLGDSDSDECVEDFVHIRSVDKFGDWEKSSVLCGKKKTPFSYISSTNKVTVYFESDNKGQHPGFEATFQLIKYLPLSTSCGQNSLSRKLKSSSGSITSYEYPLKYQNNVQCTWIISTSSSLYKFKLKFDFMDIEPSPGCKDDYVQVRDGDSRFSESLGKFCGSTKPDSFKSSESSIFVEFITNGKGQYGGFKLSYEETYNWKGILVIVVCTVIIILALVVLVGFVIRKNFCKKDIYKGTATETVNLNPTI